MRKLEFIMNMNMRQKLTVALLPIVLAFALTSTYIFLSMHNTLKNSIIQDTLQTLAKVQGDIESSLQNLEEESIKVLVEPDVDAYLQFEGTEEEEAMLKARFLRIFSGNNTITGTMVRSMFLIKSRDNFTYYFGSWGLNTEEINGFVANVVAENADLQQAAYRNPADEFFEKCGVLHYIYPILQKEDKAEPTFMVVNLNPSFLANIFARYYFEDAVFYISDYNGNLIYQMTDQADAAIQEDYSTAGHRSGYFQTGQGDSAVMTVRKDMEKLGWILSVQVPYKTAFQQVDHYRHVFISTLVLSLLVSAVFIYAASSSVVSRIQEMNNVMGQVKEGDIDSRFPVEYRDEISMLGSELNNMIDSIKYLRFDLSEKELRQREAELKALQAQINPHFLYNTLETIRMIALGNGDGETADITETLSELLRYTISGNGEKLVTLQEEIDHVRAYLSIQKLRFGDRFSVTIEVSEAALSCKTIKLVLQPLVENAFSHGIKCVERGGAIHIAAHRRDNFLELSVADNGKGMGPERLQYLRKSLEEPPLSVRGRPMIGLPNVNNRIRLFYGASYGVEIQSEPDRGTKVSIVLPVSEEG